MSSYHGVGILQGGPYTGGYATWTNPPTYTTLDWADQGFTLTALWVITGANSWVEVGYTQGYEGYNNTLLYYAERFPGGQYYDYALNIDVGAVGAWHDYWLTFNSAQGYWEVRIDNQIMGQSHQGVASIGMNVGGEMTDANNILTPTYPIGLSAIYNNAWGYWSAVPGTIDSAQCPELYFAWIDEGYEGVDYTPGGGLRTGGQLGVPDLQAIRTSGAQVPSNLRARSGGPYIPDTQLQAIIERVSRSHAEDNPRVADSRVVTHAEVQAARATGVCHSVGGDREVYEIRLNGKFIFNKVPAKVSPFESDTLEIELDATSGDILTVGTPHS